MNRKEKFKKIEENFHLSEKQLASLFGINSKEYNYYKNGKDNEKLEESLLKNFNITEEYLSSDMIPTKIECPIDLTKYKNPLSIYTEILKKYFSNQTKIYVLAKFRQKNKLNSFIDLFLKNSKNAVLKEMNTFSPSYLVEYDDAKLLITIEKEKLKIDILPDDIKSNVFIYQNYRYKVANEIKI